MNKADNITRFQNEYLDLILRYSSHFKENIDTNLVTYFFDEIKLFWYNKLEIIEFELEEITETCDCFLLCGAVYLDVSETEPLYFKSFGDVHILFDPFLKVEPFFRVGDPTKISPDSVELFKKVLKDTIEILTTYSGDFLILPINELTRRCHPDHGELLSKAFLGFVSSAFNSKFNNWEQFCDTYETYEDIEENIDPTLLEKLIFNDPNDYNLTLREQISLYRETMFNMKVLTENKSEPFIFLMILTSVISQVLDIILTCQILRLNPYIRFYNTFHYLTLIMYSFIEDENIKKMISNTILFYIFRKTIDIETIDKSFRDYCEICEKASLFHYFQKRLDIDDIDLFSDGINEVKDIITTEFNKLMKVQAN